MNWTNKTVLKFLQLYENNPCIWDSRHESHRNRQKVSDAWNNIKNNMAVSCTVKDLKKKKESLMAAYRLYKAKIRKSEIFDPNVIYQPVWFAFSTMDSFLGSVYSYNMNRNNEEDQETLEDADTTETTEPDNYYKSSPTTSNYAPSPTPTPIPKKRKKIPPEPIETNQHIKQEFNPKSDSKKHVDIDDECTIFGQLIAKKIRKLSDERRDVMMVKINQLFVDEHDNY